MTKSTHTVATDALATLGTIIDENAGRDAIHLAVEPVIASERLFPGQDVGLVAGQASSKAPLLVGIVDPFLNHTVQVGERFWLVVYPRQITSLRHVWEHPSIPAVADVPTAAVSNSEQWLRDFADSNDLTYNRLMKGDDDYIAYVDYIRGGSELEGASVPDEFWTHYEAVTGKVVPEKDYGSFFSCSC